MTNNQYISALKKALSGLDKQSRNDIIQEIQSHAAESGTPLSERFGSPEELANQYLEGEIIAKPVAKKILGIGKKVIAWIGISVVALIAAIALLVWFLSGDDFNYADENAAELTSTDVMWISKDWDAPLTVNMDQASAVFYWHDAKTVRWNCDADEQPTLDDGVMKLRHSKCLVYLPKAALTLNADQSQMVIVRPQAELNISMEQASLKVAENGEKYRYEIESSRTRFDGLQSQDDAQYTLTIKAHESMIVEYESDE